MLGELAALSTALIWSCSVTIYSVFGRNVPATSLNIYKNLVAVGCLGVFALFWSPPVPDISSLVPLALLGLSGVVGIAIGDSAFFTATKMIGGSLTAAVQCLSPPVAAVLAFFLLHETLSPLEVTGMALTSGALFFLVTRDRGAVKEPHLLDADWGRGLLFALVAAACQGLALVMARDALKGLDPVWGTLARLMPAIGFTMLIVWVRAQRLLAPAGLGATWGMPLVLGSVFATKKQGGMITIGAFFGTFIGLLLMSVSVKYAPAGIAAAIGSTYPVWVLVVERIFLKKASGPLRIICTVVAVLGVCLMMVPRL